MRKKKINYENKDVFNREDLVEYYHQTYGTTKKATREFIQNFCEMSEKLLTDGKSIQLINFGTLEIRKRQATRKVSPYSGVVLVPAKKTVFFKPSKQLKKSVNKES